MRWMNRETAVSQNEGSIGNAPVMRYEVNPDYGLTEKQVQEYKYAGWGNVEVSTPIRTKKEIVHDNIFTYFNLIFAVLTALLCMVGSFRNLTFLPVIIANILIGIVQEIRAKKVLEELTMLNAPHAFVVREGKISRVESKELVLDRPEDGKLNGKVRPLAYILLTNPIRKKASETFSYFTEQGVEVKVISGDNPLTVSEIAKEAGIRNAELYVDAATLRTKEDIEWAVGKYTVFGRVTPAQKREFVHALKRQGRTVAMTGDGVNDILALKDADCSVAMASGSEAAVQASQVVLLESDFACMPSVVMEGRRVVNNIQRSASLFLVKNIFSFLLAILAVVFSFTYPLKPAQIALISMFTIGIPAFFLALQPNEERIQGHFISNVLIKALPGGLTDVFAVGAMVLFAHVFGVDPVDTSTAATMLLAIVGFMILYRICQPFSQRPRCKQRGIKFVALQSSGVFDPCGSRQMCMQACPLGSLLAGIKSESRYGLDVSSDFWDAVFFPRIYLQSQECQKSAQCYLLYFQSLQIRFSVF